MFCLWRPQRWWARRQSNGRHIVMPGTGHGVAATACGNRLRDRVRRQGHRQRPGCHVRPQAVQRPGFFLTPAGPEPAPVALASSGAGDRAVIAAIDLKKYFGAVAAVDGVSFTARDGHVTGLLGPNGAGKTTTLRMLYGVMRPDAGTIEVDHIDATKHPRDAQAHLGRPARRHRALPAPHRARAGAVLRRAARPRRATCSRSGPPSCCAASICCTWPIGARPATRTASAPRWPSRAPWCTSRRTCCSTSRPTGST